LPEKGQKGFQPNVVENLPPHKPEKATDKAGQALGVSGRSVRDAKVIREEGQDESRFIVDFNYLRQNPNTSLLPIEKKCSALSFFC
jgi:hypothetical protein